MNPRQAQALGHLLRSRRAELNLSARALAARCGVDMATIVRLEQGAFSEPRRETLRAVAEALGLSAADVFEKAGYTVPSELVVPYPRTKYRDLPPAAIAELESFARQLAHKHGVSLEGPAPGEDEQPEPNPTRNKKGGQHGKPQSPRQRRS